MKPLAVFGTGSDAGKTSLVMALCRIFADRNLKVAPFKAKMYPIIQLLPRKAAKSPGLNVYRPKRPA